MCSIGWKTIYVGPSSNSKCFKVPTDMFLISREVRTVYSETLPPKDVLAEPPVFKAQGRADPGTDRRQGIVLPLKEDS